MDPKPQPNEPREAERTIDEAEEESFPASDPPAHGGVTGPADTPKQE